MGKKTKCSRVNLFTSEINPRKRDKNTPPVSFILFVVIRFPVLSFLEFSIHLTFLYAGVKVIHVLSRYVLELSGFLVKSRTMSECLNLYSKYRTGP